MYDQNGFNVIKGLVNIDEVEGLRSAVSNLIGENRSGSIRNIEQKSDLVREFVVSERVMQIVKSYIGNTAKLARTILFNKTKYKNWAVAWHQDKTTAVSKSFKDDAWTNWTVKGDVVHAQPPLQVFEKMITLRLHLDETDNTNGCLQVIPQSHKMGILRQSEVNKIVSRSKVLSCCVNAGDILLMHPLLLHASNKATQNCTRRILHMEFSSYQLSDDIQYR